MKKSLKITIISVNDFGVTINIYPVFNGIVTTQAEYTRTIDVRLVDYKVMSYTVDGVSDNRLQLKLSNWSELNWKN